MVTISRVSSDSDPPPAKFFLGPLATRTADLAYSKAPYGRISLLPAGTPAVQIPLSVGQANKLEAGVAGLPTSAEYGVSVPEWRCSRCAPQTRFGRRSLATTGRSRCRDGRADRC